MLLGQLEQPGRRRACLVHDRRDGDVVRQPPARRLERVPGGALELGLVLGIHPRGARRPPHRDDRGEQQVVAGRVREHGRQVQDRPAVSVGRVAHEQGHDAFPSFEWWRL